MGLTDNYLIPFFSNYWLELVLLCLLVYVLVYLSRLKVTKLAGGHKATKFSSSVNARQNMIRSEQAEESNSDTEENKAHLVDSLWPNDLKHIPYHHDRFTNEESLQKSKEFYELLNKRRSVRAFSSESVPQAVIENIVKTAGTSPSGAHTEPWTFVIVGDSEMKKELRSIVEAEEEINYAKRMGVQWVKDVKVFKTTNVKPYLTEAPWVILVFKQTYGILPDGRKQNHYYHEISSALAGGMLLAAIEYAGLVALTTTPLNCGPQIRLLFDRPANEKLLLLLPVGYPAPDVTVPDLKRKPLEEIMRIL